jgi:hypothetical protein
VTGAFFFLGATFLPFAILVKMGARGFSSSVHDAPWLLPLLMLVVGNKVKQERVYEGRVSGESASINASTWSKRLLQHLHLQTLLDHLTSGS